MARVAAMQPAGGRFPTKARSAAHVHATLTNPLAADPFGRVRTWASRKASTMRRRAWMFCSAKFSAALPPCTLQLVAFGRTAVLDRRCKSIPCRAAAVHPAVGGVSVGDSVASRRRKSIPNYTAAFPAVLHHECPLPAQAPTQPWRANFTPTC